MEKPKILVAGDICEDIYLFSTEQKANPECSSAPILKITKQETKLGMGINVFNNLENMNTDPGPLFNSMENISKTRVYLNGQYLYRIDKDDFKPEWDQVELIKQINYFLPVNDAVIVSDYGKGFWNKETLETLNSTGALIFIDPYTDKTALNYPDAFCITPNLLEGQKLTGAKEPLNICKALATKFENVVLKVGENGCYWFQSDWSEPMHFPAEKVVVIDVCGAGDTFIAALTSSYLHTKDMKTSIQIANKAAALTVQHLGVYAPTKKEWREIFEAIKTK